MNAEINERIEELRKMRQEAKDGGYTILVNFCDDEIKRLEALQTNNEEGR